MTRPSGTGDWKPTGEMFAAMRENAGPWMREDRPYLEAALIAVQPLIAAEALERAAQIADGCDLTGYTARRIRALIQEKKP